MSDEITKIVIPILRGIQTDVSLLKRAVQRLDGRIASLDSHMAGFHQSDRTQNDELDDLRGRIEALERTNLEAKSDEPQP